MLRWPPQQRSRGSLSIPTRSSATWSRPRADSMAIRGQEHILGHHIDTDVIIPARYLLTSDPAELARYVFEDLDPALRQRVQPGDILVAGEIGRASCRERV